MKIRIVAAIAIQLLLTLTGIGQSGKIGSPVKWERYGVPRTDVSVLLPKLPIRIDSYNPCNQLAYSEYWAYADNAAYGIRIFAKYKTDRSYCKTTEDFGKRSFDARISKWSSEKDTVASETEVLGSTRKARVFSSKVRRVFIVDDLSNNRWIELEIVRRNENTDLEAKFVSSLTFKRPISGIDIGDGSAITLGDEYTISPPSIPPPVTPPSTQMTHQGSGSGSVTGDTAAALPSANSIGLMIVAKPRPSYTDSSRQVNIQGTVILRTTFLANGSIGAVSVVKSLPYGLTEHAIAAARRIVFLPAQPDGVNFAVTKQVEYTFSIY